MNSPAVSHTAALTPDQQATLDALGAALAGARASGDCRALLAAITRARTLLPRLPAPFEPVLAGIEQRIESSALFAEESCSFSLGDLFDSLDTWAARARVRLLESASKAG